VRIPLWLGRLKRILLWPIFVLGTIFAAIGAYFTARDTLFLELPGWFWLTSGVVLFAVSVGGMLYQFQRQVDSVVTVQQPLSNFPKRLNYTKAVKQEVRESIDEWIKTGEGLKERIDPNSRVNLYQIRIEIAALCDLVESEIGKKMPEFSEYIANPPIGLDTFRYSSWDRDSAVEGIKIDGLLLKLRKIRLQL